MGKIPWRRKWQPLPVFLPRKSHGQRSMLGGRPWGHTRVRCNLVTKQQKNPVVFSTVTLCDLQNSSPHKADSTMKPINNSYSSLPQPQTNTILPLNLTNLARKLHLSRIIQYFFCVFFFFSHSIMALRFIHIVAYVRISFFLRLNNLPLCGYTYTLCLSIYLSMNM